MSPQIQTDGETIAEFCRKYRIQRLSFFGSVLRDDFQASSDIDVLVDFEAGHVPGLLKMATLEIELSQILGRKADLRTPAELSRHFRDEVIREAQVQYVAA
jgi:predicted nucleotidyltransferase